MLNAVGLLARVYRLCVRVLPELSGGCTPPACLWVGHSKRFGLPCQQLMYAGQQALLLLGRCVAGRLASICCAQRCAL
jgi:hypothetical protein